MSTKENNQEQQNKKAGRYLALAGILGGFLAAYSAIIGFSIQAIHTNVEKIIDSLKIETLSKESAESDYQPIPVLKKCAGYIGRLSEENRLAESRIETLEGENGELKTLLENKEEALESACNSAENELKRLFAGGEEEAETKTRGGIYRDEDDTIVYMAYVPKTPGAENPVENCDRLEIDMYKRTGAWTNDVYKEISATLPPELGEATYQIRIVLREGVQRSMASQPEKTANGGSVEFYVNDTGQGPAVKAGVMRLNEKNEEKGNLTCKGGDTIRLRLSPQGDTYFFSCVVCIETPETDGQGQ